MLSTTCPKCRYVRQSTDVTPDWQCPSCGVAYSKAMNEPYVVPLHARRSARSESRAGWGKWLLMGFIAFGAYLTFAHSWRGEQRPAIVADANAAQPEVELYATSGCPYCAKTREYVDSHHIRYTEYDIERSSAAAKGYRQLRGNGVPVVVVGEQVIHGYQPDAMEEALRPWLQ